jgi:hypothetical protein
MRHNIIVYSRMSINFSRILIKPITSIRHQREMDEIEGDDGS